MARKSWLDEGTEARDFPIIDEQVQRLDHFTKALADGVVDDAELRKQQDAVVEAMKAVETELSDDQHAKVTRLLVELSAFNIMATLHELTGQRLRKAFGAD